MSESSPQRTDLCPRQCSMTEESGRTTSLAGCTQCIDAWRAAGGTFESEMPKNMVRPCSRKKGE